MPQPKRDEGQFDDVLFIVAIVFVVLAVLVGIISYKSI